LSKVNSTQIELSQFGPGQVHSTQVESSGSGPKSSQINSGLSRALLYCVQVESNRPKPKLSESI